MKIESVNTIVELFICNHSRSEGAESCHEKGAKNLTDDLKKWSKENHKGNLKIYRSGCLGKCDQGIAMTCYPEKKFILEARPRDLNQIKDDLEELLSDQNTKDFTP